MLEKFELKETAFPLTPHLSNEVAWYGFPELKKKIKNTIARSLTETSRVCTLNRGQWGVGKTHAASFFSNKLNLPDFEDKYSKVYSYIIESPKETNKAFIDFFNRVVNAVTFNEIKQCVSLCRQLAGDKVLEENILQMTKNEDVAHVLSRINDDNLLMSKTYLNGGGTATDLKKLGVAKKLITTHEFAVVLSGIFYVLINSGTSKNKPFNRLILWIDEMEDLVYFPTRHYRPFTQALRDVIDKTTDHFTLFLNFTFTEPEDLASIETVLGEAIMSRINQHIIFGQSQENDVQLYLKELLADNRTGKGPYPSPETYPFGRDTFNMVVKACVSHTPRYINKFCDKLLRQIVDDPDIVGKNKPIVTSELVEKYIARTIEDMDE